MNLRTFLKSHINSLRFLMLFKQKKNQNELVELALKERGMLYKLIQNLTPELIQNQEISNSAISKKEIIDIIETNFKIVFRDHFKDLSEAVFCASIGQVHRATHKNGTTWAIKVQYPNVKKSISSQLNLLKVSALGSKISKIARWKIDINSHVATIEARLTEELDYLHEQKNLIQFRTMNPDCEIYPLSLYSSSLILSQTWIEGHNLVTIKKNWPIEKRKEVAQLIVEQYFKHAFIDGFFQGDNNLSNFIITENPVKLHWIDFGNWISTSVEVRHALVVLVFNTIHKKQTNFLGHFKKLGFDLEKLKFFQNTLPNLLEILFDPFLVNRPFDLASWRLEERINNLLGENKWWFRSSGDSSFLELMKSFLGLIKVIEYLDVNINWHSNFVKIITSFNLNEIESNTPTYPNSIPQATELAHYLLIQVFKDSKEHVKIELPASSFFDLENFIPEDVHKKLKDRSLNLSEIKFKYLEQGLVPGKVFELADAKSVFQVHLV